MLTLLKKAISFALCLPLINMCNPSSIRKHLLFSSLNVQMQMFPRSAPPSNCNQDHLDEGSGRVCCPHIYFVQLGHFPGICETGTLSAQVAQKIVEYVSFLLCPSKFIWLFFLTGEACLVHHARLRWIQTGLLTSRWQKSKPVACHRKKALNCRYLKFTSVKMKINRRRSVAIPALRMWHLKMSHRLSSNKTKCVIGYVFIKRECSAIFKCKVCTSGVTLKPLKPLNGVSSGSSG